MHVEGNKMTNTSGNANTTSMDRCQRLRELRVRLNEEIHALKEDINKEEEVGVDAPVETKSIIKSLQNVLNNIDVELQKCT